MKHAFLIILLLLSFAGCISGQSPPLSNVDILASWIDSSLVKLKNANQYFPGQSIALCVEAPDSSLETFVQRIAQEVLLKEFSSVLLDTSSECLKDKMVLRIQFLDWQVNYKRISGGLFRSGKFERNLSADFFVEVLHNGKREVLYSKRIKKKWRDVLAKNELEGTEHRFLPFSKGQISEKAGFWKKWIEPAFLFAISGTIIYLFYSTRSS